MIQSPNMLSIKVFREDREMVSSSTSLQQ